MADVSEFPEVLDPLRDIGTVISLAPDADVLCRRLGEFDAYFASLAIRANAETLLNAHRLRAIATPSTGHDHLDLDIITQRGIQLISLRGDTEFLDRITATAELTWCLLLAVVRRLPS